MRRILRTSLADSDLSEIWAYIARDNATAANTLLDRMDQTFREIAANPDLGIHREDIRVNLYCKPVQRRYLIFYECTADDLIILRVLHAARDHNRLFLPPADQEL